MVVFSMIVALSAEIFLFLFGFSVAGSISATSSDFLGVSTTGTSKTF